MEKAPQVFKYTTYEKLKISLIKLDKPKHMPSLIFKSEDYTTINNFMDSFEGGLSKK